MSRPSLGQLLYEAARSELPEGAPVPPFEGAKQKVRERYQRTAEKFLRMVRRPGKKRGAR